MDEGYRIALTRFLQIHRDRTRWLMLKILVAMLGLSILVTFYTNLSVLCSSIGIICLASYFLLLERPEINRHFKYSQISAEEKWFIFGALMLVLDLPLLSLCTLVPWAAYGYNCYRRNYSFSFGEKIMVILAFLQWELILIRYDKIITISWGIVAFILWIPALFGVFMFYVVGIPFLRHKEPFPIIYNDWDDWDIQAQDYTEQSISHRIFGTVALIILWIAYVGFILPIYWSTIICQLIFLAAFGITLADLALFCIFKKEIIHYLYFKNFKAYIAIRKTSSLGYGLVKQILNKQMEIRYQCMFCNGQAQIIHPSCGYVIFCDRCFAKRRKSKRNQSLNYCPICNTFHHSFMKLIQIDQLTDQSIVKFVKPYLYIGQHLLLKL